MMLPSSGYFKNILCPFFKVGLCCRPHCHYKHVKKEILERLTFSSIVTENELLLDTDGNTDLLHSNSNLEVATAEVPQIATYIPTPVDRTGVKVGGILKDNSRSIDKPSTSSVPEYKPTPIARLKDFHVSHIKCEINNEYFPEHTVQSRKRKKVEEYDPAEVKCTAKKRVSFAIESESGEVNHIIPEPDIIVLESSEESEDDVSGDVPKFSDDDLDDGFDDEMLGENFKEIEEREPFSSTKDELTNEVHSNKEELKELSLVDKIIVDSEKNEQLMKSFKKPIKTISIKKSNSTVKKLVDNNKYTDLETNSNLDKSIKSVDEVIVINSDIEEVVKNFIHFKSNNTFDSLLTGDIKAGDSSKKCNVSLIDNDNKLDNSENKSSSNNESSNEKVKTFSDSTHISKNSSSSKNQSSKKKLKTLSNSTRISKNSSSKTKESKIKFNRKEKICESSTREENSGKCKDLKNSKHNSSSKKLSKDKLEKVPSINNCAIDKSKISKKRAEENDIQDGLVSSSSFSKKEKTVSEIFVDKSEKIKKHKSSSESQDNKFKKNNILPESKHKKTKSKNEVTKVLNIEPSKNKFPNKYKIELKTNESNCTLGDESLSSDSDHDEEECWRIYNETYPNSEECTSNSEFQPIEDTSEIKKEELIILGKKRLAHQGAEALRKPKPNAVDFETKKLNPVQVMHNRYAKLQAIYARQSEEKGNTATVNCKASIVQKKLIANMPNYSLIKAVTEKNEHSKIISCSKETSESSRTPIATVKGAKRLAHVPLAALKPKPIIPIEFGSRVPTNVRQKFLNTFIDEYLKFCLTEDKAYENALNEEKQAYDRSSSRAIYMNVASNAVSRLRRRAEAGPQTDSSSSSLVSSTSLTKPQGKTISHESMLVGPWASKASFSIERKKTRNIDVEIKGLALYKYLMSYALAPEQLVENGFPLMHPTEPSKAVISGYRKISFCNDAFKKTCSRCSKIYYVNTEGSYVKDEECDFHWGHLWKRRIAGAIESRYSCCQGDSESEGCCVASGHVFEGSEAHSLKGFVRTLPKTPPPDKYYGVYALDCEMCYTTAGMELTRVTVIDPDLKPVFESFVKPQNKVLDYNTRFSGITEEDLKNVKTSLRDIQAVLLCIFNDKTILIGHSLENDFKALKLFHKTVVDTSVVFPHKIGLPFKRSLKTLMAEKLNKIIQNNVGGHDSNEDALACMELMIWKIKEDLKSNR